MAESQTRVLVTGATGNQGGAVARHLLKADRDFDVRGLTRDTQSDASRALKDLGVTMVEGDLYNQESFRPHVADVDALFAVTNFWTEGYEGQVEQGTNIAEVSAEEGVNHFVFSGVGSHHRDTGIPHFDSAWEIERHAKDLDLPMTVLQPVFFFQNFEGFADSILDGTLAFPLEEDVPLAMVDVDDVGRAASVAFSRPDDFIGDRFELAGEEHTLAESAEIFSTVTGVEVEPVHVPIEEAYDQFGEEFTIMCEWFNEVGYDPDFEALRKHFGFKFTDLETYLRSHGWEEKEGMAAVPGWVKAMQ